MDIIKTIKEINKRKVTKFFTLMRDLGREALFSRQTGQTDHVQISMLEENDQHADVLHDQVKRMKEVWFFIILYLTLTPLNQTKEKNLTLNYSQ